jgi:hypothetical protein
LQSNPNQKCKCKEKKIKEKERDISKTDGLIHQPLDFVSDSERPI